MFLSGWLLNGDFLLSTRREYERHPSFTESHRYINGNNAP